MKILIFLVLIVAEIAYGLWVVDGLVVKRVALPAWKIYLFFVGYIALMLYTMWLYGG